jgi:hypothetical protein
MAKRKLADRPNLAHAHVVGDGHQIVTAQGVYQAGDKITVSAFSRAEHDAYARFEFENNFRAGRIVRGRSPVADGRGRGDGKTTVRRVIE